MNFFLLIPNFRSAVLKYLSAALKRSRNLKTMISNDLKRE